MTNKRMMIALAGTGICLLVLFLVLYIGKDRKAPEIQFDGSVVTYREGEDPSILFTGVSARDSRDGDVSATLTISSFYPLVDGATAKVYYAASDKAGNVARASRIIYYQAAGTSLVSGPETDFSEGEPDEGPETGAGDESPTDPEPSATEAETEPEPPVTQAAETEPPAAAEAPVITLSQSEVSINRGQSFYFGNYIDSITDDKDSQDDLFRRLNVNGDYDTNTPGTYQIRIFAVDTDGNRSNEVTLTLHVL